MNKICIVIQGPCYPRTQEIINYYLEHNKNTFLIFSTWVSDLASRIAKHPNLIVTENEEPILTKQNANRMKQRLSTYKGIKIAEQLGFTHILKVRSDCLIRRSDVCNFLRDLQKSYPVLKIDNEKVHERIICGQVYSRNIYEGFSHYHASDIWVFMNIFDAINYFTMDNIDIYAETFMNKEGYTHSSIHPESDFAQVWLLKVGVSKKMTNEEFFGRYFMIVDETTVNHVQKTLPLDVDVQEIEKMVDKIKITHAKIVSHEDWIKMYENLVALH